jgi:7-dehydrocholesterol reductase
MWGPSQRGSEGRLRRRVLLVGPPRRWETGYWGSMDIAHDRAGFYLCWGCLVWVPGVYTSPVLYLANHPVQLGWPAACALFAAGALAIFVNYDSDRQRQTFRATGGKALIWGKPAKKIVARYKTGDGLQKESLLLTSGDQQAPCNCVSDVR